MRKTRIEKFTWHAFGSILVFGMIFQIAGAQYDKEASFWQSIRCSDEKEVRAYLRKFPDGAFVEAANECLEDIYIENFLSLCQAHVEAGRLTSGASGNALECYQSVLERRPENVEAQNGLNQIEEINASWAQEALHDGNLDAAARYLEELRALNPQHRFLRELEAEITAEILAAERRRSQNPLGRFTDCEGCPEMVVVPAGTFNMGSNESEEGIRDYEGPVHQVTISVPFAVGKYEVTFSEWDACVAAGGCGGYRPDDEGWGRGNRPVINVSWEDAQAFVGWLSRETGQDYRLLTESEWEYAARAGTTEPFHFGSTISTDQANYDGNSIYGNGRKGVYRGKPMPVGSFPPNKFSLYDMHGNVWEWVEDCWHKYYLDAPVNGSAWTSGNACDVRVLRGGSWNNRPRSVRAASRGWNETWDRNNDDGFRVARTLTP